MSYAAAIEQLNTMMPELYQKAGQPRRKFSLNEIGVLLAELGNPQLKFPSILIAGTNGKGSTAATLASILSAAGVRTGLFTSPHLERANERIQIDRIEIADDDFARQFFLVSCTANQMVKERKLPQLPSYFEILTAQSFLYFAEAGVEIAVLEVGMGGRLDATNIVDPLFSVITDISLDHMEWLGPTISAIAREKAGIMRRNSTLVTLPQHPEANQVLGEVATELNVRGVNAARYMPGLSDGSDAYTVDALGAQIEINSPLKGAHQHRNLALAIAAAVELAERHGFPVTPAAIAEGIRLTRWPGRLERVSSGGVEWILDVAHNPAGAWALRAGLRSLLGDRALKVLVFGCLRDKPITEMAQILFPLFEQVILAPIHSSRAASVDELLAAAHATGTKAIAAESVSAALKAAEELAAGNPVVVSGSVYLVGEARALLLRARQEP
ncbi:MAG: folylpolyglutamate synthase/dihydrofolate synthase family protein [Terracidiphilus sp.]|jgi:dihydrofolate synthase/folylpolyglutamate synthase